MIAQQENELISDQQLTKLLSQVNSLSQKLGQLIAATPLSPTPNTDTQPMLAINCIPPGSPTDTTSKPSPFNMKRLGTYFWCGGNGAWCTIMRQRWQSTVSSPNRSAPYTKALVSKMRREYQSHRLHRQLHDALSSWHELSAEPCPSKFVTGLPLRPAVKQMVTGNGTTIEVDGAMIIIVSQRLRYQGGLFGH